MKNKIAGRSIIAILAILVIVVGLCGSIDEKSKFIGTWQYSEGGIITFLENNTVSIDNIDPVGDFKLLGIFDYTITNNQITFTSKSIGISLNYAFPDSNTLILVNDAALLITLIKI